MLNLTSRLLVLPCLAACLALPAVAQDWTAVPHETHAAYNAVDEHGGSVWQASGGAWPFRMVGVVLNDTEDWLAPAASAPAFMGGQAEFFFQAVDLDGTAHDPSPGELFGDFGGTAVWMGQKYGNMTGEPTDSYSDAEWTAELGRLGLFGGDGVTQPLRAGTLVEVRARAGRFFKGKLNINEDHSNDPAKDFEIVVLDSTFGLPAPASLTLGDFKDTDDNVIFDPTRQAGPEAYQSMLVTLQDVRLVNLDGSALGEDDFHAGADLLATDPTGRTFPVHIGRDEAFDTLAAPTVPLDLTGIVNQEATSMTGPFDDGYFLMVLEPATVPEPATLGLLGLAAVGLLRRKP